MKISDTIIGSIIIGGLVGGAILLAESGSLGSKERLHEAIIIDAGIGSKDENSDIEFHIISNDMLKELPSGVANTLAALREALEASSEDLGWEMESDDSGWKIESEDSGWKIEIRTEI